MSRIEANTAESKKKGFPKVRIPRNPTFRTLPEFRFRGIREKNSPKSWMRAKSRNGGSAKGWFRRWLDIFQKTGGHSGKKLPARPPAIWTAAGRGAPRRFASMGWPRPAKNSGARRCAQRQPQHRAKAAAGRRPSRAPPNEFRVLYAGSQIFSNPACQFVFESCRERPGRRGNLS